MYVVAQFRTLPGRRQACAGRPIHSPEGQPGPRVEQSVHRTTARTVGPRSPDQRGVVDGTRSTWRGGSSVSRPSTTSSSSRSRSVWSCSSRSCRRRGTAPVTDKWLQGHQVLRQALPHQLRDGRRHRHRAGVPVRHELERLLPLRRRHLRCAARGRGPARVLPRVDVHRPVDLRLGPAARAVCTWPPSGPPRSAPSLSAYFILAANSFMQHPVGYSHQPGDQARPS